MINYTSNIEKTLVKSNTEVWNTKIKTMDMFMVYTVLMVSKIYTDLQTYQTIFATYV